MVRVVIGYGFLEGVVLFVIGVVLFFGMSIIVKMRYVNWWW